MHSIPSRRLLQAMADSAREFRQRLSDELDRGRDPVLHSVRDSLAAALAHDVSAGEAADVLAQAAVCAAPIIGALPRQSALASQWLSRDLTAWERWAVDQATVQCQSQIPNPKSQISPAHLFEPFLQHYDRDRRKRRGVFFTPRPIADYIVSQADRLLREECGVDEGMSSPQAWILDPAVGTGIFLLSVIDHLHSAVEKKGRAEGRNDAEIASLWNEFVPNLLPRLVGIEILPAAALLAKLNIAVKLAETGYRFQQPATTNIVVSDALDATTQSKIQNSKSKIPVLLGNPPFSSLSTNTNDWIARLVRGDEEIRGYVRANGQCLNERKTWLHDDYVKFLRLAQWHVEEAGCGIVGFVTNHGYLDNATFRLMRHELMRVFPSVRIVDLHGNRKKHEVAPDGSRDENVFGLDQGVAIGLFCRSPLPKREGKIEYAELWGSSEGKQDALKRPSLTLQAIVPKPPDWRFIPAANGRRHQEYESAWSLADAMPVNATAPVTARDHFVVAFTAEELQQRIGEFRDLSIPDDEIRRRYFTRTRSARYPPGETRGWKLSAARRLVAADNDWQGKIIRCLYRPFDWRFVFWHPAMIDWPREHITRHLIAGNSSKFKVQSSELKATLNFEPGTLNWCLIARRQQLPMQPCTFFWIADGLALDGVIRSDNRGSESLFPLYVRDNTEGGSGCWQPNFATAFLHDVETRIAHRSEPLALLAYIYALFHSPGYRERYANELRTDFPRVLLPSGALQFDELSQLGRELIDLHLLRGQATGQGHGAAYAELESFRVGGHVALRKWLQPKHRSREDATFGRIVTALSRTQELIQQLDRLLPAGSWPSARLGR